MIYVSASSEHRMADAVLPPPLLGHGRSRSRCEDQASAGSGTPRERREMSNQQQQQQACRWLAAPPQVIAPATAPEPLGSWIASTQLSGIATARPACCQEERGGVRLVWVSRRWCCLPLYSFYSALKRESCRRSRAPRDDDGFPGQEGELPHSERHTIQYFLNRSAGEKEKTPKYTRTGRLHASHGTGLKACACLPVIQSGKLAGSQVNDLEGRTAMVDQNK